MWGFDLREAMRGWIWQNTRMNKGTQVEQLGHILREVNNSFLVGSGVVDTALGHMKYLPMGKKSNKISQLRFHLN